MRSSAGLPSILSEREEASQAGLEARERPRPLSWSSAPRSLADNERQPVHGAGWQCRLFAERKPFPSMTFRRDPPHCHRSRVGKVAAGGARRVTAEAVPSATLISCLCSPTAREPTMIRQLANCPYCNACEIALD